MSSTIPVQKTILDNVVSFVEVSSLMAKQALDEITVHRQGKEKSAALVPPLLAHMLQHNIVLPHQKTAAEGMLGAHDTTLQLLKAASDKIVELNAEIATLKTGKTKRAGDLGEGVGDSGIGDGEFNSLTHPIVGEKTAQVKQSDIPFLRLIGKA